MPLKLTTYYHRSDIPELPGNNTFHSIELFHIYEATPGYTPLLIVASEAGRPFAKLLAAIRKSVRLFPPSIIKRCEIYGTGEYFDETVDKEFVFGEMLQRLTAEALREAFLIEFRNLENSLFGYKSFRKNHYFAINWLRVRNSLHSIEHVESRFSPSRIRQIKKGLKMVQKCVKLILLRKYVLFLRCCTMFILLKYAATSPAECSSNAWKKK